MPKYPDIELPLAGEDGNAFFILSRAARVMRKAKLPQEEINAFEKEATSGDYEHLLTTCLEWFDCN